MAFWSALRRWGERALASGRLSLDQIKNGVHASGTPVRGAISPAPIPEPRKPASASVAPAERPGEAARLLDELFAVTSEGWQALAAAMSQELFDRLKRWHASRLAKN
jgi:hypothetical protein